MKNIIDAHIHLDQYAWHEIQSILRQLEEIHCTDVISVSTDLRSCMLNSQLSKQDARVRPAFGFHPEQPLLSEKELLALLSWIDKHQDQMIAVGEVGLPYYLRKKQPQISYEAYIEYLELFLKLAKKWDKPVILHAIYEDAMIVCDLLEKHHIKKAHFHWFKGDANVVERIRQNGYFISVTPDLLYESDIQQLVTSFPLNQLMVETDGPWPFEGIFQGQLTHPRMIHHSIEKIAMLKKATLKETYEQIYENTNHFYNLKR